MKTKSRMLAIVMALLMIATMLPVSAFAENDAPATGTDIVVEELTNSTEEPTKETASPAAPGELPGTGEDKEQGENSGGEEKTAGSTPTPEPTPIPSPEPSKTPAKQAAPAQGADDETPPAAIFTVTFDANGHGAAPSAIIVKEGETITEPDAPTADGYTFTGWYRDKEATNQWNFDTDTATDNIILYAGWMEIPSAPAPVDDTLQDKEEEETVTAPMLRSTAPALRAPLQNGGLRAGQTFYLDLKYEGSGGVRASTNTGTEGTVVSINAYPGDGYRFQKWELLSGTGNIGDVNNANTTFTMGTTDATVKAVFEILPAGENSLVCFVFSGGTASATADPNDSAVYMLQATPASGYKFDFWKIKQGNGIIDNSNAASTTIRNCIGSVVVEANFSTIAYLITTNANPGEGGRAERLPYYGGPAQQVNLTATPNDSYVFKEWKITSGAGRITNPTEACTVLTEITGAVTCQAEFERIPSGQFGVRLTKNFYDRGEATASVSYGGTNSEVTLTATPASGYVFNRREVERGGVTIDSPNSATTTFQIGSEDVTVKAVFSYDAHYYNITTQAYGCGSGWTYNNQGESGDRVSLGASPESGWSFDHWEVVSGGVTIDNEYAREASFVMRDQDVVVRAVFVPEQTNLLREIKVTNPPKKDTYTAGESFDPDGMVVTAYYQDGTTDVSGYTYEPSGALAETDTLITIRYTINGETKETTLPITVAPAPQYAINVNNGTADKATATAGEPVTITANPPAEGKAFVQWPHIDGVDYAQADSVTTTFTMPAKDVELTPVYADILIPDIADQTYTGEAITPRFSLFSGVRLDGVDRLLVQGMHYEITYDKNIDAGEATLTVTMKAPSAGSKSATFQILPVDIEVTTGSATKDEYDGTPLTCQTGAEITGLLSGETATVRATGSQTDVGTSDNTYEIEWGTAKAGNYNVAKETLGTLTVASPKPVTVTANDASKTYGQADPTLTATATGLVGSDTVSYTLSRETGEDAGTYVITPTGEAAQGNYTVSFAPGMFTIEKAPLTLSLSIEGWTEGETANAPVLTGNTGNGAVTYEYKLKTADEAAYGTTVPTAAGEYTVRATVSEISNYLSGETTADFTIGAAPAPVTITYEAKDSAGNTVPSVTWQKGSGKTIDLTIKRSEDDSLTFGKFVDLEIDGVTVGSANYGASEGSLKLSIKPEYLETLSVGDHTVKVNFQDGSATVKLTVKAAASNPDTGAKDITSPKTGDESNLALWSSLMFLSVAAMFVLLLYARKRKIEK